MLPGRKNKRIVYGVAEGRSALMAYFCLVVGLVGWFALVRLGDRKVR